MLIQWLTYIAVAFEQAQSLWPLECWHDGKLRESLEHLDPESLVVWLQ